MSKRAKELIQVTHPHLAKVIDEVGTLRLYKRSGYSVPEAVARTVIGQMLSASAASTIRERAIQLASETRRNGISDLPYEDLRKCGLSGTKARAIREFSSLYRANSTRYEGWRSLPKDRLFAEVNQCWGLSDWSASILGIFYFGNADILPEGDGSIRRAIHLIEQFSTMPKGKRAIDADLCRPYRSYLALYLWKLLDAGVLAREAESVLLRKTRANNSRARR